MLIHKANGPPPPPSHATLDAFLVGTHATSPNSCYLTAACPRQGRFFFLVNLDPGAAVGGMRIEINTEYSCLEYN